MTDDANGEIEMGSACFHSMPGLNNEEPAEFFRILRIAYVRPIGDILAVEIPVIYPFTYESFTPEMIRIPVSAGASSGVAGSSASAGAGLPAVTNGSTTAAHRSTERLEKMKETFAKIIAYLRNSGSKRSPVTSIFAEIKPFDEVV